MRRSQLLTRFACKYIAQLPDWLIHVLAISFKKCSLWSNSKHVQRAKINIDLCFPHWSSQQKQRLLEKNFYHSPLTALQAMQVWTHPKPKQFFNCQEVVNADVWHSIKNNGKCTLFMSPHIGNWELITLWFAENNINGIAIYAPVALRYCKIL